MAEKTQLNVNLNMGNATVLNRGIACPAEEPAGNKTVLNPQITMLGEIAAGTVLCGKYRVLKKMEVTTGEADLYICEYQDKKYVAKLYRRSAAIKAEVANQLKKLDSPYVARIYENTKMDGKPIEILPYYERGSLQGVKLSYKELHDHVIPCLNEGLRTLHEAGIIHKDLKPSNIMVINAEMDTAIIDFGISSVAESGNTVVITKTGMTPAYSAPETFRGVFLADSDYYSLGITLYELFCGEEPYHDMTAEQISQFVSVQRLPLPDQMPAELKNLINGLTYYDISNRDNKKNPNRRWGYEEVKKWLAGEKQIIPGEGTDRKVMKPYFFAGRNYTDRRELIHALAENWNEGKKELFRGKLAAYYRLVDQDAFKICQQAEYEAARLSGKDDLIFWSAMCELNPKSKDFFWKGRFFAGLPAMGRALLEDLRYNRKAMTGFMNSVFAESIMSRFVKMKDPKNDKMVQVVEGLEKYYNNPDSSGRDRKIALYLTAYMLSGQKILYVAGMEFHTLGELASYMQEILGENNEGLESFKEFCHRLMDQYENLTPALESWLVSMGKQAQLDAWKNELGIN